MGVQGREEGFIFGKGMNWQRNVGGAFILRVNCAGDAQAGVKDGLLKEAVWIND